jgi:DNA-directed RNA polymerase specialized sigma24 family protein
LSYEEIAASLGLAVGTVKSRLTRARYRVRAELSALR